MNISVFGLGYVGFTAACCMASQGHTVVGVDVNESKVDDIAEGIAPFEEPGLHKLLSEARAGGRLTATRSPEVALQKCDLAVVCVGTPSGPDGAHDMRHIVDVSRQIATALSAAPAQNIVVTFRSTMRPGSIKNIVIPIFSSILGEKFHDTISIVYNPEFLREGRAIWDYFNPPKIVVGTIDGQSSEILDILHAGINAPVFVTSYEEAEITKFVDNSWHAVKVAYANEVGRVCQKLGISASIVHKIFVSDTKLNVSPYYLRPGGAFGGSCLPKDVRAFQSIATDIGANAHVLDSLLRSNEAHKHYQFEQIVAALPKDGNVLMAGLAFKAETDDLRESPNVDLARKLLARGMQLRIFDPALVPAKLRGQNLGYAYVNLPSIDKLLISKEEAEARNWDLVIESNTTANLLNLEGRHVIETHTIR